MERDIRYRGRSHARCPSSLPCSEGSLVPTFSQPPGLTPVRLDSSGFVGIFNGSNEVAYFNTNGVLFLFPNAGSQSINLFSGNAGSPGTATLTFTQAGLLS